MGRRPGQSDDYGERKRKGDEEEDLPRDQYQQFTSDEIDDESYRNQINQFLSLAKHQSSKGLFYLYRVIKGGKRALIHKTKDFTDLPDEHEIGLKYGSGDFEILMTAPNPDKRMKNIVVSHMITIDTSYDELRRQSIPNVQQYDSGKSLNEALTLIQGIMATLIPLIRPPESGGDIKKLFDDMYSFQGNMMKRSVENSLQMINDYQRKMAMLKYTPEKPPMRQIDDDEDDTPPDNFGNIITQIMPLIKEYLPKIISSSPDAKIYQGIVKQTELFKEISKNKKMVDALVNHLDKTQGEEVTTKLLNSLGIKRLKVLPIEKEQKK